MIVRVKPSPLTGVTRVRRPGRFLVSERRALVLGLPLVRALTVAELRAVVAHELAQERPLLQIPEDHGLVLAGARQAEAVGRQVERRDRAGVRLHGVDPLEGGVHGSAHAGCVPWEPAGLEGLLQ